VGWAGGDSKQLAAVVWPMVVWKACSQCAQRSGAGHRGRTGVQGLAACICTRTTTHTHTHTRTPPTHTTLQAENRAAERANKDFFGKDGFGAEM